VASSDSIQHHSIHLGAIHISYADGEYTDNALRDASRQHRYLLQNRLGDYADPRSTSLRGGRKTLEVEVISTAAAADVNIGEPFSKIKVSYVTSFWAEPKDSTKANPHRREMEAALMANIHNPHFDQVVVFLDGVSEEANCAHFLRGMNELNEQLGAAVKKQFNFSKLTCVDVHTGQPTYYQMFKNTLHEAVKGDVVILANADQAFDDTISQAQGLNPEVLLVLGTRGFSFRMPPTTKYFYETLGNNWRRSYYTLGPYQGRSDRKIRRVVPYRYGPYRYRGRSDPPADRCLVTASSFDTYIFHKSKLSDRLREEYFQRPNANNEMKYFYMNENGAENAALWALQQSYPFTSVYNACDRIHSWHFHLTPQTHKARETAWQGDKPHRVPRPASLDPPKDPQCVRANNCFFSSDR
jgi:hypothetical protein